MRVHLVSRIFAPEPAAASFRLSALAKAFVASGDAVTVSTSSVPPALRGEPAEIDGVRIRRAPVLRDRTGYVRGYLQYLSFDIPAFFRVLFSRRAEVIVVEPPPTTGFAVRAAAAIRRTPYAYYAADIWSDASESTGAPRWVVRAVRRVERSVLNGARLVIAVSDGVRDRVLEIAPGCRVTVVPNGVDTEVFGGAAAPTDAGPLAVYAGTASEWQGADLFIRAMPAVLAIRPDARMVFVGQGSAWNGLRELAERIAPDAIEFRNPVRPSEAARLLGSARAGLVSLKPGLGYDFAVPTKIFATAGTGTPVILASARAAASSVIEQGGLGDAVGYDVDAVAAAMITRLSEAPSASDRASRVAWVETHASSSARGAEAASAIRVAAASGRS